jgi:hypothetical protein
MYTHAHSCIRHHTHAHHARGGLLVVTLVMATVFTILSASLLRYVGTQHRLVASDTARAQALHIAEAGVEYYRWRLSHFPDDITDGTGAAGPYTHVYYDPEGDAIGEFSLDIGGDMLCEKVQVVYATSTGFAYSDPEITRTVFARIARPTVADYSYIVDSNVWAGDTRTIIGPYHSNGVIRMEGDNRSAVTSKIGTSTCNGAGLGGCTAGSDVAGIYGGGTNPQWWLTAQPDIPFSNFDFDFTEMESLAQTDGIFLPKLSNDTSLFGYSLELQADGTVDIYRVHSLWKWLPAYLPHDTSTMKNTAELSGTIADHRTFLETRTIPADCPLLYIEDRLWIEGTVNGKVTVVAHDTDVHAPDVYIPDHITYTTTDGSDGLSLLAENNLIIPLHVPNTLNISGVFMALNGSYGRPWYSAWYTWPHDAYRFRSTLNTTGTVVSKLRTGTQWSDGQGFTTRNDNYDRNLVDAPPPLTPFTSSDFRFIEWQEVE